MNEKEFFRILSNPFLFYLHNPDLAEEVLQDNTPEDEIEYALELQAARRALAVLAR